MSKPQPQGMKTNYKTRLVYPVSGADDLPVCLFKAPKCANYKKKCGECSRIQGKYTQFEEKV